MYYQRLISVFKLSRLLTIRGNVKLRTFHCDLDLLYELLDD